MISLKCERNIYLQGLQFVDIVELQNDISGRPSNARGTTKANINEGLFSK